MSLIDTKEQAKRKLLNKANVHSVGIGRKNGTGDLCVVVSVDQKVPLEELKRSDRVPKTLGNYKTDVVVKPKFRLYENTGRMRPAQPGLSIGHKDITAGTFGCVVEDNETGAWLILSNNHVLANVNQAEVGDEILQPGAHDGGTVPDDVIGTLEPFVPIVMGNATPATCPIAGMITDILNGMARFLGSKVYLSALEENEDTNLFDAALARPIDQSEISPEILELGVPTGYGITGVGEFVKKKGRTSDYSEGTVEQVNVTIQVQMDEYGLSYAVFEDQVLSDIHSEPGDSGSAILNANNEVVGLLFAGGDGTTAFCRIDHILSAYNVKIVT